MWPGTRRICASVAEARVKAAVVETLESRRLLTAATGATPPVSEWELTGADGASNGHASLDGGILHVVSTNGNDEIQIGTSQHPGKLCVMVNDAILELELSRVHGVVVDAGAGDDGVYYFDFNGLINLPTTINGGAGDDDLYGEYDRNNYDEPIAFRKRQSSYADVVLNGGDGDDRLDARIGDTTMIGGAGNDQFVTADAWGHNTIVDDDPPPPAPPAKSHLAASPAPHDVNAGAAPRTDAPVAPAPTPPTPFSTQPLTAATNGPAVLGDPADALWDVLH